MPYIGNTVQNQGFAPAIDYFSGNGVTVTFTLSRPIASVAQVICAIDNVIQNPSSAFTVSGNSITFTSAPLSGTNNIWVEYTSLITTYAAISQDPSVIGDITASGGYLSTGDFGNSYIDGIIVDYVTGAARLTTGPVDDMVFYHGGSFSRSEMMRLSYAGNSYIVGNLGVGTTTPSSKLGVKASGANGLVLEVDGADSTASTRIFGKTATSTGGIFYYDNSGNPIWAITNSSTVGSSTGTTNLTVSKNGLALGNYDAASSGIGIKFPATQSASTDPNTLDDYEEGTFTPVWTINGVSTGNFTYNSGNYTKIGNMVTIWIYMYTSTGRGSGTGAVRIQNLPFTAGSINGGNYHVADTRAGIAWSNPGLPFLYQPDGQTNLIWYQTGNSTSSNTSQMNETNFSASGTIEVNVMINYKVA